MIACAEREELADDDRTPEQPTPQAGLEVGPERPGSRHGVGDDETPGECPVPAQQRGAITRRRDLRR